MGVSLDNNSYSSTPRLQKHVLDTVIQLPLMTHLSLVPAYPESQRHNRCGTGRRRHRHQSKDEIEKNVKRYRPLPSCQYLIEVRVGDTTFEGIRAANGRLRYVAVWEFVNLSVRFLYYTCKSLYRTSTQIAGKHPATSTFPSQIFSKFKVRDGRNSYCMWSWALTALTNLSCITMVSTMLCPTFRSLFLELVLSICNRVTVISFLLRVPFRGTRSFTPRLAGINVTM